MTEGQEKAGKRVGRPPKNPTLGKRINAMFRLNEATRDRLMAAAGQSGRSMSEEIERRVEESLREDAKQDLTLSLLNGSEYLKSLIVQVSSVVSYLENLKDINNKPIGSKEWRDHEPTRAAVRMAVIDLINDITSPVRETDGKTAAQKILEITSDYQDGGKISDEDLERIKILEQDLKIEEMVLYGRTMAGIITGKIKTSDIAAISKSDR